MAKRSKKFQRQLEDQAKELVRIHGLPWTMALQVAGGSLPLKKALQKRQERVARLQQRRKEMLGEYQDLRTKISLPRQGMQEPQWGREQVQGQPRTKEQPHERESSSYSHLKDSVGAPHQGDEGITPTYDVLAMFERRKAKENAAFLSRGREQLLITERGEKEQESESLEQGEPHTPSDTYTVPGLELTQETTLDELVPLGSLPERLHKLNTIMANISPERVRTMVSQTIRRDTKLVKALKEFHQFHCQFSGCNVRIPKRGGGILHRGRTRRTCP